MGGWTENQENDNTTVRTVPSGTSLSGKCPGWDRGKPFPTGPNGSVLSTPCKSGSGKLELQTETFSAYLRIALNLAIDRLLGGR